MNNQPKNQQQPIFCAILFSKINPNAHVSTKNNTFTFYKDGMGAIAPRSKINYKKKQNGVFSFFRSNITYQVHRSVCNDMDSDSCKGDRRGMLPLDFFVLQWCNLEHSECSKNPNKLLSTILRILNPQ